jgi:hypothetical protein
MLIKLSKDIQTSGELIQCQGLNLSIETNKKKIMLPAHASYKTKDREGRDVVFIQILCEPYKMNTAQKGEDEILTLHTEIPLQKKITRYFISSEESIIFLCQKACLDICIFLKDKIIFLFKVEINGQMRYILSQRYFLDSIYTRSLEKNHFIVPYNSNSIELVRWLVKQA